MEARVISRLLKAEENKNMAWRENEETGIWKT